MKDKSNLIESLDKINETSKEVDIYLDRIQDNMNWIISGFNELAAFLEYAHKCGCTELNSGIPGTCDCGSEALLSKLDKGKPE